MCISSGKIQSPAFAPVVVQAAVGAVNPLNWNKFLLHRIYNELYSRDGMIVKSTLRLQSASQTAVQKILMRSEMLQTWLDSVLNKELNRSPARVVHRGLEAQLTAAATRAVVQVASSLSLENFELLRADDYVKYTVESSWQDRFKLREWDWGKGSLNSTSPPGRILERLNHGAGSNMDYAMRRGAGRRGFVSLVLFHKIIEAPSGDSDDSLMLRQGPEVLS